MNHGSVRGFPMVPLVILPIVANGTIGLPMVPLEEPMVPLEEPMVPLAFKPMVPLLSHCTIGITIASAECYNVLSPFFELFKCHIPLEPE